MKKYYLASLICCSLGRTLKSNLNSEAMDVGILPHQVSDLHPSVMSDTNIGIFNPYIYLNLISPAVIIVLSSTLLSLPLVNSSASSNVLKDSSTDSENYNLQMCAAISQDIGGSDLSRHVNIRRKLTEVAIVVIYKAYIADIKLNKVMYEELTKSTYKRLKNGEKGLTKKSSAFILGLAISTFSDHYKAFLQRVTGSIIDIHIRNCLYMFIFFFMVPSTT